MSDWRADFFLRPKSRRFAAVGLWTRLRAQCLFLCRNRRNTWCVSRFRHKNRWCRPHKERAAGISPREDAGSNMPPGRARRFAQRFLKRMIFAQMLFLQKIKSPRANRMCDREGAGRICAFYRGSAGVWGAAPAGKISFRCSSLRRNGVRPKGCADCRKKSTRHICNCASRRG